MAEPASSTAVGVAIAAGTITLTGSILGVQYDALLAGFFGGLVSLSYLPSMPALRTAGSVATSAMLAGFFAPVIAAAGASYFPWVAGMGGFARIASGAALGICAQVIIPSLFAWIRARGGMQ